MASGHKKRKAQAVASVILAPANLTNYLPADLGNAASQLKLLPTALYKSGAISPSFTEGSTTILSDAVSNADGNWTLMGSTGETAANAGGFLKTGTIHRYLPHPGVAVQNLTDSVPVLLYSKDGPQGFYNPAYLPTTAQVNGTGSIKFSNAITGAAGGQNNLKIWIAGSVPTGAVGSIISVYTGSNGSAGTALLTFSASATPLSQNASFLKDAANEILIVCSSSANTYNTNSFTKGVLIYISGSA